MNEQPRLITEEQADRITAQPDAARSAYAEHLRVKLRDPEFRKTKGFSIGSDDPAGPTPGGHRSPDG